MGRLVEEGKVHWAGVSNFDVPLLERCKKIRHVDSRQPPFSLITRQASAGEIPWCAEHVTGVIIYSPMQSGLLTEKWTVERVKTLAPDDWRRRSPDFQSPNLEKNLALRDALTPIAERHGTTIAAVAVAWTLAWRGGTGGRGSSLPVPTWTRSPRRSSARARGWGRRPPNRFAQPPCSGGVLNERLSEAVNGYGLSARHRSV